MKKVACLSEKSDNDRHGNEGPMALCIKAGKVINIFQPQTILNPINEENKYSEDSEDLSLDGITTESEEDLVENIL